MLNQPVSLPPRTSEPTFVLARGGHSAVGHGVRQRWDRPGDAARALRTGDASVVVGCLPFDTDQPAALFEPVTWTPHADDAADPLRGIADFVPAPLSVTSWTQDPQPEEHRDRVARAVQLARTGGLDKVVLARALTLHLEQAVSAVELLRRFVADDHRGNGYLVALPEDTGLGGGHMVGSSPEVLIERTARAISTHPLAGTAARHREDRELDRRAALRLQSSEKDLAEHRFVVDAIEAVLRSRCTALDVPPLPTLTHTERIWHLGTPIRGVLAEPAPTALELAVALHPTPAVCGSPHTAALEQILRTESPRGCYAGAVGWCDASGDGHWRVVLRGGHLAADGRTLTARAGGGIVADSQPDAELAETRLKFTPVLRAVGFRQRTQAPFEAAPAVPSSLG